MKHIIRLYLHISKWSSFEVYSNFHEVEDEDQEEGDVATITGDHKISGFSIWVNTIWEGITIQY